MVKNNQLARLGGNNGFIKRPDKNEFLTSVDRMFDDFFNNEFPVFTETFGLKAFERHSYPKVDIYHTEKGVSIESEIPGLSKDNLKIKMKDDVLTICGEKRTKENEETKNYLYRELKHSSFCRSFKLAEDVFDIDKLNATFEDGVLLINIPYLPKIEKTEPIREFEIK